MKKKVTVVKKKAGPEPCSILVPAHAVVMFGLF